MPETEKPSDLSELKRLAAQFADWNGKRLNTAAIGRRLGVSRPTAMARVTALESEGLIRLLPFLGAGKRPLLFLRDACGLLPEPFQAFCIDAIVQRVLKTHPEAQFFWWETGRTRHIDLVAAIGEMRIGFCFSASAFTRTRQWCALAFGCWKGAIHFGYFLDLGDRPFMLGRAIKAMPLPFFLADTERWIAYATARIAEGCHRMPTSLRFRKVKAPRPEPYVPESITRL